MSKTLGYHGGVGKRKRLVLQVRLDGEVVEGRAGWSLFGRGQREELQRLVRAIRRAAEDRRIGGLLLSLAHPVLGWAKAAGLARAIRDFRRSGKPTVAFLEGAGNVDYLVACACETLVMPPSGTLHLHALQAEVFFVKDLLGWLGVEAEIEAVGEYKSAGEMFMKREMSEPHREELQGLLEDLSRQWGDTVSGARSMDPSKVRELADQGPYLAEEAQQAGWIDRIGGEDECESIFEASLGAGVVFLPHGRYRVGDGWLRRWVSFRRPCVAIIHAVGLIGSGEDRRSRSPRPVVGARSLGTLLKRVRDAGRVKAVVLRVESPGGTALASELVWREIERTRERKPVIVSLGDVAASGGYYIAAAADAIVSEASTLTGSIGIVGGKVVVRRLLDRLGVARETVSVSHPSSYFSMFQPFTSEDREKLVRHLRYYYEKLFVPRVARGRGLSHEHVHQVGRGRVWTGRQGKDHGLVDELGDLDAAVELAKKKAGIAPGQKVRTVTYAKRARLRHLFSGLPWSEAESPLAALLDLMDLVASEDVLFLMPRYLRIR